MKYLFIDRDGTLIEEPKTDFQVDSLEKLEFLPGVFKYLGKIVEEMDYRLVMVTNQDGLGTKSFPEETFWPAHNKMMTAFGKEGIYFEEVLIDRSFPEEQKNTRKPNTGLVLPYLFGKADLENSFVIGDRESDVDLATNMGCNSIMIGKGKDTKATHSVNDWSEIYRILKGQNRWVSIKRKTKETSVSVKLNLDGQGNSQIQTGLGFFDHMLEQIARHGHIDLFIDVNGDLQVDEHHTIEDTALTLGKAFAQALGSKKGINRYGFLLPMDDALATVAIDFGGRPWLVWDASFKREKIGDVPTEMFYHFFKSFTDAAGCNLHIKAEGRNEHHKIEAIFKGFAKSVSKAISSTGSFTIPSTKGLL